ncbi:MAG: hypothetical protein R3E50_09380 [Halioglobus sp.]
MQQRFSLSVFAGMALTAVVCNSSMAADWVVLHAAPDASLYTDPSSIDKNGDSVQMWVLIDYKQPQPDKTGKQVLSDKLYYQFHCKDKTQSIVATTAYAGPMASGDIINENPDAPQVMPIEAGTLAEDMWKLACGGGA